MNNKNKRGPQARNAVMLMMLVTRKGGAHLDKKKEARRKAGRVGAWE